MQKDKNSQRYSVLSRHPHSLRNHQRSVSDGIPQTQHYTTSEYSYIAYSKHKSLNRKNTTISQTTDMTILGDIKMTTELKVKNGKVHKLHKKLNKTSRTNSRINYKIVGRHNGKYLSRFLKAFDLFRKRPNQNNKHFLRNGNDESTNSISNTSLQDMDETEFSSSDLMKYMEEVNEYLT